MSGICWGNIQSSAKSVTVTVEEFRRKHIAESQSNQAQNADALLGSHRILNSSAMMYDNLHDILPATSTLQNLGVRCFY